MRKLPSKRDFSLEIKACTGKDASPGRQENLGYPDLPIGPPNLPPRQAAAIQRYRIV